jgi:hypothetical protein
LNDEYYAFFLTNTLPYLPQNVYRDPQGMTVWTGNVVQFYPNGTLPDNLYFDPNLVYRIEIRHGNSQTDPLIYEINNFIPGTGGSSVVGSDLPILTAENQGSNTNFSEVNFSTTSASPTQPTTTILLAGTYEIAPDWFLELSGAGSTVLTQLIFAGIDTATSPNAINYALRIANNGWSSAILYQRFHNNGGIFTGGAVSMSITARAQGVNQLISLVYQPSDAGVPTTLVPNTNENGQITTGLYRVVQGTKNLDPSVNTDLSTVAYVDMQIVLPPTGTVDITDFQVVGQSNPIPAPINELTVLPSTQQISQERMIDHLFHVYRESILKQPKESLLTGWNFALNPWQFRATASSNVANNTYTADQTIVVQRAYVAAATANNIAVGQATFADNYAFAVTAVTADNKFALIQYIAPQTIRPYWGEKLSIFVRAKIKSVTHSTKVAFKAKLIYRASLPPVVGQTEPIASWGALATDEPVLAAGWTTITTELNTPHLLEDGVLNFSFDEFQLPASTNADMTLGIMIYTMDNLDQSATADQILFERVSLVRNDFAIDVNTETFDQSLEKCRFYYEKSYDYNVAAGSITSVGMRDPRSTLTPAAPAQFHPFTFSAEFLAEKRVAPEMTLYSPVTGSPGAISAVVLRNGTGPALGGGSGPNPADITVAGNFLEIISLTNYIYQCLITVNNPITVAVASGGDEGFMQHHYIADSRLGV